MAENAGQTPISPILKHFLCHGLDSQYSIRRNCAICVRISAKSGDPLRSSWGKFCVATGEYRARVHYAGDEFFIGTSPGGVSQVIDVKGDRKSAPSPMEMLLIAVAACTAADVISILQKKRQNVTAYDVEVTGERFPEHPRKFTAFHVHHIVQGRNISEDAVKHAIELSDQKYCSVAAAVRPTAEVTTSYEIVEV